MILLADVTESVKDSKAVLADRRKTLLSFVNKYLTQIEIAEKKINQNTKKDYIDRVNDQREFIDSLIDYLQETDNTIGMLSAYIRDMLEFYETEITKGGQICRDVEFWKSQAVMKDKAKKRLIGAFSKVLTKEQNEDLFKHLIE